jgi:hypothetical protein
MAVLLAPDTVNSSTLGYYNRRARDQFFTSTSGFQFLLNSGIKPVDGGITYNQPIIYNTSPQAGVWGGGVQQIQANFIPNTTLATWSPAYYYGAIGIPDTVAIQNQGQSQIVDIVEAQYEQMVMALIERLGIDFYGNGAAQGGFYPIQGLGALGTSGSDPAVPYGNISRVGSSGSWSAPVGQAPWWNAAVISINGGAQSVWSKPSVNPGTSTLMSYNALFAWLLAGSVGMYRPMCGFTDAIGYQAIGNLFVAIARESSVEKVFANGPQGLDFAGIPIFQDDKCTSGTLYGLNDMLELRVWKNALFVETPWRQPSNAMVNVKFLLLIAAMVHSRPNTVPILTGITG